MKARDLRRHPRRVIRNRWWLVGDPQRPPVLELLVCGHRIIKREGPVCGESVRCNHCKPEAKP
jgi:hypothetical protein